MLYKLFSLNLMEQLFGKLMRLWGSFIILEVVTKEVGDGFLCGF